MLVVEFFIEPFVEGHPGPHVLSAVAAAEALGAQVEFGPFGSTCTIVPGLAGRLADAVFAAAFEHGATRVTMQADLADAEPAADAERADDEREDAA